MVTHLTNLWNLGGITKRIWKPKLFTLDTKFPHEEKLTVKELPHE